MSLFQIRAGIFLLGFLALAGWRQESRAANVTLTGNDPNGANSSFNLGTRWSDLNPPSAGNDYFTSNFTIRTPAVASGVTFAGSSLTIDANPGRLIYQGAGSQTVTINDLRLNGGTVFNGIGGSTMTLAGAITLNTGTTSTIDTQASGRAIIITAPISGSGNLRTGAAGIATLAADNNYTGTTTILSGTLQLGDGGTTGTFGTGAVTISGTLTFNRSNTLTINNTLSGAGTIVKNDASTTVLTAANSGYSGSTQISAGTLRVNQANSIGTGAVTLNGGTLEMAISGSGSNGTITLANSGYTTGSGVTAAIHVANNGANSGNTVQLNGTYALGNSTLNVTGANGYALRINSLSVQDGSPGAAVLNPTSAHLILGSVVNSVANHTLELGGAASGNQVTGAISNASGTLSLQKTGASTWRLSGANTYSGATTIDGGTLWLDGATHSGAAAYTVNAGGTLKGAANISAHAVTLNGVIAPGNSVGTMTTGAQTWTGDGGYQFEINDVAAGAGVGWDLLNISGALNLAGLSSAHPFEIKLTSLTLANMTGVVHNFDPFATYEWLIAQAGSNIANFDSSQFIVDRSAFLNNSSAGRFQVVLGSAVGGNASQLYLQYVQVPVPEPSTLLLAACGLLAVAGAWRKRKRMLQ